MGSALVGLVKKNLDFHLSGIVERKELSGELNELNCPVKSSLAELFAQGVKGTILDFTAPTLSVETAELAAKNGCCVVIGTTGFDAVQKERLIAAAVKTPIFQSANMSVGVNALLQILPRLTRLLGSAYDMEICEIHHRMKKDSPSGTAIKLGQCLAEAAGKKYEEVACCCREGIIGARSDEEIGIQSLRGGDVVGDHTVFYFGRGERIEITHRAHSRETFAQGALRAAAWIVNQKAGKLYGMEDMLL